MVRCTPRRAESEKSGPCPDSTTPRNEEISVDVMSRLGTAVRPLLRGVAAILIGLSFNAGAHAEFQSLGLPELSHSVVDHLADRERLGGRLFSDPHLSDDGTISCATCHPPSTAFMDRRATGRGIGGQLSFRNTPSLLNVAYMKPLFWDGRADSLEAQLLGPLTNPREHGLADASAVVKKVKANPVYVSEFSRLYGIPQSALSIREIADAISDYERTLVSGNSPFDRFVYGHENGVLSPSAKRGLELFQGRAGCSSCHLIGPKSALFTDLAFHRSPQPLPDSVTRNLSALAQKVVAAKRLGANEVDRLTTEDPDVAELGRFVVTLNPADIGAFRTPSLRNVALTAPYMHDGRYASLPEVIDAELYSRGAGGNYPIALTVDERGDLLAFLNSLTGSDQTSPSLQ